MHTCIVRLCVAALIASTFVGMSGNADVAAATRTLAPAADASVFSNYPASNFGEAPSLLVDAKPRIFSFVKFDLSALSDSITSATLRLYVVDSSRMTGGEVATTSNSSWTESAVTYNNRPAIDGPVLANLGSVGAGRWVEIDVTSDVASGGIVSFGMSSDGSDGADYSSREGSRPPQLVVTFDDGANPSPDMIELPGLLEVEDYRAGGQGVGYNDTTAGNSGGAYRADDVDIQACNDPSSVSCHNVGWIANGEWLEYVVNFDDSGTYTFIARVASPNGGKRFHLMLDQTNVSGSIEIPTTGGYQTWTDISTQAVSISAGTYRLRFVAETNGFNLNYLVVTNATTAPPDQVVQVRPTGETAPVPSTGDAADDPAIWVHPTDPSQSTIIGTDKQAGLAVYDLAGNQLQYRADGKINNVDLRYGFPLGDREVALVAASNRGGYQLFIYAVDSETRLLENVSAGTIQPGVTGYGTCMYHSRISGKYYVFIGNTVGEIEQWELFDNGSGAVSGRKVRAFDVGLKTEGCVADDGYGHLYIGEEEVGIWKYGAEPDSGAARTMVDSTGSQGHLIAQVEGLTIYHSSDGGYLIASSQGSNSYVIYQRGGNNSYIGTFQIVAGNGIDGVTDTDGIDVTNVNLGPLFPNGVFVVQDGRNDIGNQNFKLVPWQDIALSVDPPLDVDTR